MSKFGINLTRDFSEKVKKMWVLRLYQVGNIDLTNCVIPALSCSLIMTLISSSWWRSEVSRSGRRSPTLGCSLAMVTSALALCGGGSEGRGWPRLSDGVGPSLPEAPLGPPAVAVSRHLCVTTAPLLFTFSQKGGSRVRINGHMTTPTTCGRTGVSQLVKCFDKNAAMVLIYVWAAKETDISWRFKKNLQILTLFFHEQ